MPKPRVTADFIAAAIAGYEFQKDQIESKIAELQAILLGGRRIIAGGKLETPKRKRILSAAARKRIAYAQKKRWAAYRKRSKPAPGPVKKKPTTKKVAVKKVAVKKAAVKNPPARATKKGAASQAEKRRTKFPAKKAVKKAVTQAVSQEVEQKTTVAEPPPPETTV
jgi:hypothetical protein